MLPDAKKPLPPLVSFAVTSELMIPKAATRDSAGLELRADVLDKTVYRESHRYKPVPTGVRVTLPSKSWADIRSKSGYAFKRGVTVFPGLIDADYRDELLVGLKMSPADYFSKAESTRRKTIVLVIIDRILRATILLATLALLLTLLIWVVIASPPAPLTIAETDAITDYYNYYSGTANSWLLALVSTTVFLIGAVIFAICVFKSTKAATNEASEFRLVRGQKLAQLLIHRYDTAPKDLRYRYVIDPSGKLSWNNIPEKSWRSYDPWALSENRIGGIGSTGQF